MSPWIIALITTVHVVVCLFLIGVVLLQSGKSADIAAAFGGMGSQTAFGPRSAANALTKATTWAAIIFMLTSFTLAIAASRSGGSAGGSSVLDNAPTKQAPAPAKSK
jgi:preprotein translocase subunit SecG